MEKIIKEARELAYGEAEKNGTPAVPIINLSTEIGKRIAGELGANIEIVEIGTLLMDCVLGQAIKENRQKEHIQMSYEKTDELLKKFSILEEDKNNIKHCVLEHHGVKKFYSLESEICCNADCYRFISVKGIFLQIRNMREMPFEKIVEKLEEKVNEKWNALTLDIAKNELSIQYELIIKLLENLKVKN